MIQAIMGMQMMVSDYAIVIYEAAGIAVLLFFIIKLLKKRRKSSQEQELDQEKQLQRRLEAALQNKNRRK